MAEHKKPRGRYTVPIILVSAAVVLIALAVVLIFNNNKKTEPLPAAPVVSEQPAAPAAVQAADPKEEEYAAAMALLEKADYENALTAFKKLGDFKDSAAKAEECEKQLTAGKYEAALKCYEEKDLRQAAALFTELGDYEDSAEYAEELSGVLEVSDAIASAKIGDIVTFGAYEQDANDADGKEPVEWYVMENDGDTAVLVSRYVLDCHEYHPVQQAITWDASGVRSWLNSEFKDAAFAGSDALLLTESDVPAAKNRIYANSDPGKDTVDCVWLLTEEKFKEYVAAGMSATVDSTPAAKTKGTSGTSGGTSGETYTYTITIPESAIMGNSTTSYATNNNGFDYGNTGRTSGSADYSRSWWLRPPGKDNWYAMFVNNAGDVIFEGSIVNFVFIGIRPAVSVKLY